MIKFYVTVKTSLFANQIPYLFPVWYDDSYWFKIVHTRSNKEIPVFMVTQTYLNLLVKPRIFRFRFSEKI